MEISTWSLCAEFRAFVFLEERVITEETDVLKFNWKKAISLLGHDACNSLIVFKPK